MKIKFKRLDYQEQCRDQILGVFKGIDLREPENDVQRIANPVFEIGAIKDLLLENIENLRSKQKITQGSVGIEKSLNCDILMETGTGKTFCFLECVYALHQNYRLSKFIVLVPSNAIKLGVLKSVGITREFFKSEYSTHLESYEDIRSFILASNHKCCVLVMTFSAFNKEKNTINKSCLENTNLFNGSKSYMQALASICPVVIMDEPHRFLGDKTKKYLEQLNALVTLRFGATFKDDYKNLIYALDSKKAFDCALVKSISVASVGESNEYFLELKGVVKIQNDYEAAINYTNLENKTQSVKVKKHDNLGVLTQIGALEDYIVENITKTEARFLNGFNLLLDQKEPFSHLLEGEQEVMLKEAIKSHFEREEGLFKKGIKALCMVFISGVNSYLSENEKPAKLALLFEKLYQQKLEEVLKKDDLDNNYRAYLERTKDNIQKVHGGYFAKSKKESLRRLEELFLEIIYQNIRDRISYQMRETTIKNRKNDAFYDEKGEIREFLDGSLGAEKYEIKNASVQERCLYENFMQVESEIEKDTIEESNDTKIIVFGKLPRVKIPIGLNQTYSPDFGYVVENNDKKVLLVVETKGVENESELREEEKRKISTAKKFFEALKKQGVNIEYKTKIKKDQLSALINEVLNRKD